MTRQEAMTIVLSFVKLFYNEIMAGNVKIQTPKGYMEKLRQAIDLMERM